MPGPSCVVWGECPPKSPGRRDEAGREPEVECFSLQDSLHAARVLQLPTCSSAATSGTHHFAEVADAADELLVPQCIGAGSAGAPTTVQLHVDPSEAARVEPPNFRLAGGSRLGWCWCPVGPIEGGEPLVALTPRNRAAWALVAAPRGVLAVWARN